MPLAPDKPYLYVDGTKQDVSGAALLCPEINQQDLLQGVLREVFGTAGSIQSIALHGCLRRTYFCSTSSK